MNRQEKSDRIREIIAEHLGVGFDDVKDDANLKDDLGFDSLDHLELALEVEAEWNDACISEEKIASATTVIDFIGICLDSEGMSDE